MPIRLYSLMKVKTRLLDDSGVYVEVGSIIRIVDRIGPIGYCAERTDDSSEVKIAVMENEITEVEPPQ